MGLGRIRAAGYQVVVRNHAAAILEVDFPEALSELACALEDFRLSARELVESGGGEAISTQRLRRVLSRAGWPKHVFRVQMLIDGVEREAVGHEIDHVRATENGRIALEIEWNNKDPFFDRDLENFQRLHVQSAISAGVIITRGSDLHHEMAAIIEEWLARQGVENEDDLTARFSVKARTSRQRNTLARRLARSGETFAEAFAHVFVADKFGAATTHWSKLTDRVMRGVGNPCPLLLVGMPRSRVDF